MVHLLKEISVSDEEKSHFGRIFSSPEDLQNT